MPILEARVERLAYIRIADISGRFQTFILSRL